MAGIIQQNILLQPNLPLQVKITSPQVSLPKLPCVEFPLGIFQGYQNVPAPQNIVSAQPLENSPAKQVFQDEQAHKPKITEDKSILEENELIRTFFDRDGWAINILL